MNAVGITENIKGDAKKFELWYSGREEVYLIQVSKHLSQNHRTKRHTEVHSRTLTHSLTNAHTHTDPYSDCLITIYMDIM